MRVLELAHPKPGGRLRPLPTAYLSCEGVVLEVWGVSADGSRLVLKERKS